MKRIGKFFLAVYIFYFLFPLTAHAGEAGAFSDGNKMRVNINFLLAPRSMQNSDFWGDFDEMGALDVSVDFGRERWPLYFIIGISRSAKIIEEDNTTRTALLTENYAGLRKYFHFGGINPYLGGGISLVTAVMSKELDNGTVSYDDRSLGYFLNGGFLFRPGKMFHIGLEYKYFKGTAIEFAAGEKGEADFSEVGMVLGFGW